MCDDMTAFLKEIGITHPRAATLQALAEKVCAVRFDAALCLGYDFFVNCLDVCVLPGRHADAGLDRQGMSREPAQPRFRVNVLHTVKCLIYGTAQVKEQAGVGQSHVGNRSLGQK
jgi:hypothetical protein